MKKPMSAQEWFESQGNQTKTNYHIDEYANYLLKHHLEQFAEDLKINGKAYRSMMGMQIDRPHIDKLLTDYLTKNNI